MYLIIAFDNDGMEARREELRQAHRDHLKSMGKRLIGSGALLDDDGKKIIGGMSVIDTDDKQEAIAFADSDPYSLAGIRKKVEIVRWRRRWIDGAFNEVAP